MMSSDMNSHQNRHFIFSIASLFQLKNAIQDLARNAVKLLLLSMKSTTHKIRRYIVVVRRSLLLTFYIIN